MTDFTAKQKADYLKLYGCRCPVCKSADISAGQIEVDGPSAWSDVKCEQCGSQWQDVYTLTDIEPVRLVGPDAQG